MSPEIAEGSQTAMKLLFCSSEAYPFVKTGGLGDIAGSLPYALADQGMDVKLVIPAYRSVLESTRNHRIVAWLDLDSVGSVRILQIQSPSSGDALADITIWLIDIPRLFDRPGNPYLNAQGDDWSDNAERFCRFSEVIAKIATDQAGLSWRADVVHAHDWQSGLVPAFLSLEHAPPKTLFTIHNLAYGGHFPYTRFQQLQLPAHWWNPWHGIEFHGGFSMLKAGILFSDWVSTVSPTYADEICTPEFGYGFEGLLQQKKPFLRGILNGIDQRIWNPETDTLIAKRYHSNNFIAGKRQNKQALLQYANKGNIEKSTLDAPLFGLVGRLVEQKGIDLLLSVIPQVLQESNARFFLVGNGQQYYENALLQLSHHYPGRVSLHIGYSEKLAHLVEAGSDVFMMPSRFEPCGLNQLYSLRYGTLPLVHATGGLADTVNNASLENIANNTATGFVFYDPGKHALLSTFRHILHLYPRKSLWRKLQKNAMSQDFSWQQSAETYQRLYQE